MAPPIVSNKQNVDFSTLSKINDQMAENTHLAKSKNAKIYVARNSSGANHTETGVFNKKDINDTKKNVKSALEDFIGKDKAAKVLSQSGVKVGGIHDGKAITKKQLTDIREKAIESKAQSWDSDVKAMSHKDRRELAEMLNETPMKDVMEDPKLGPLFEAFCKKKFVNENLDFLNQYKHLETLHDEYRKGLQNGASTDDLRGIENEIRTVTKSLTEPLRTKDLNVRNSANWVLPSKEQVDTMDITQLKSLKDGKLKKANTELHKLLGNDVFGEFQNAFTPRGTQQVPENKTVWMQGLRTMEESMSADDHLRMSGSTLYRKSNHRGGRDHKAGTKLNHGKTHFWGGKRAKKFQAAKTVVQNTLAKTLGDEKAAKQIMKPFINSSRALTKADLKSIISAADQMLAARSQADQLVRDEQQLPTLSDLASNRPAGWTDAFADFCEAEGSHAFHDAVKVTDFQQSLQSSEKPKVQSYDDQFIPEDANQGAFDTAQAQASELLERKGLSDDLRNELKQFVALKTPPSDTARLRNMLAQYREGLTRPQSEVGGLYRDFQSVVQEKKDAFQLQQDRLALQQQPQQSQQSPNIPLQPSENQNPTTTVREQMRYQPGVTVAPPTMSDFDDIVNINDVNLDEEPSVESTFEIEKSYTYEPDQD